MKVNCKSCGVAFHVKEQSTPRLVKCPKCSERFVVKPLNPRDSEIAQNPTGPQEQKTRELFTEFGGGKMCAVCQGTKCLSQCEVWAAKNGFWDTNAGGTKMFVYEDVLSLHGCVCYRCKLPTLLIRAGIILIPSLIAFGVLVSMLLAEFSKSAAINRHQPPNYGNMMAALCCVPTSFPALLIAAPLGFFLWRKGAIGDNLLWNKAAKPLKELGFPISGAGNPPGEIVKKTQN